MELSNQLDHTSLLDYGELLARNGQLDSALQAYSKAFSTGSVERDRLFYLITALVKFQSVKRAEELKQRKETLLRSPQHMFACILCNSLFLEPVTLACGHTFCKGCFEEECLNHTYALCKVCASHSNSIFCSVNILLSSLIQKWCPEHHKTTSKIVEGKKLLENNEPREAIKVFNSVFHDNPQNINALCWRSDSFMKLGLLEFALKDIETAIQLQPLLTRTVQRKARILAKMGHLGESAIAYIDCLVILPTNKNYREDLATVLNQLFSPELNKSALQNCHQFKESVSSLSVMFERERMNNQLHEKTVVFSYTDLKTSPNFPRKECQVISSEQNDSNHGSKRRKPSVSEVFTPEKEEFECKLCLDILLYPVTTPCGHTFCLDCLKRTLDHRTDCPCCRSSMAYFLEEKQPAVNEVLELVAKKYFSSDYAQKKLRFEKEINRIGRAGTDSLVEIPIFVCTMAFPGIKCPLHIFEPHYRLMIRRCIESGSRCFGMCIPVDGKGFADVGTILEIQDVDMLPDGRSIITTVGAQRFRVLERGVQDGYCTAKSKWLTDDKEEDPTELEELSQLNETCYCLAQLWFKQLSVEQQHCVVSAVGSLPELDEDPQASIHGPSWIWWVLAALPLDYKPKQIILAMTTVEERLKGVQRFLIMLIKMQQKLLKAQEQSVEHNST